MSGIRREFAEKREVFLKKIEEGNSGCTQD
jgi:hypothetical protein